MVYMKHDCTIPSISYLQLITHNLSHTSWFRLQCKLKGVAMEVRGPEVLFPPPLPCKPFLSKQRTTGVKSPMTIWWVPPSLWLMIQCGPLSLLWKCWLHPWSYTSHQQANPARYKDLLLGFVNLQTMILEGKIAKDYDYHGVASPWIQMKLLRILALLGADDQK